MRGCSSRHRDRPVGPVCVTDFLFRIAYLPVLDSYSFAKMSNFSEQECCIEFCHKLNYTLKETVQNIQKAFGDDAFSSAKINEYYEHLEDGRASSESLSDEPSTNEHVVDEQLTMSDDETKVEKKRGRSEKSDKEEKDKEVAGKKRGRPATSDKPKEAKKEEASPAKRSRGRPKGSSKKSAKAKPKTSSGGGTGRGRGRPKKKEAKKEESENEEEEEAEEEDEEEQDD